MSYKSFEFSLKTDYVFTENAAEALKGQLERYKPAKPFVITSDARFKVVGQVKEMLEATDRSAAGPTAPPEGLTLVDYRFL